MPLDMILFTSDSHDFLYYIHLVDAVCCVEMGSDRKQWNQQISFESALQQRTGFEMMQTKQIENRGGDYYFCAARSLSALALRGGML
jgi:hypothetical protein